MSIPSQRVVGVVLTTIAVMFLALDAGMKLARLEPAIAATGALGFSPQMTQLLGLVLAVALVLHAVPVTSVLGAILLTAYLGGSVAVQLRHGSPLFTHVLFGVYVGLMVWAGLWLRSPNLRALVPLSRLRRGPLPPHPEQRVVSPTV